MFKSKNLAKFVGIMLVIVCMINLVACTQTTPSEAESPAAESSNVSNEDETQDLYIIKYLRGPSGINRSDETEVGKVIKEKFNIVFEFEPYTGDWTEKAALMLAAKDYPEMLPLESDEMVSKYIKAGAALCLDDLMDEYGPDFKERFVEAIPYWRLPAEDGKTYKYETTDFNKATALNPPGDVLVRSDLLEAMGWPELESEDSWVEFLKSAMEMFPDTDGNPSVGMTVPFAEAWGVPGVASIMFEKGKYTNAAGNKSVIFDNEQNKYVDYLLNPYVKESYQFFNRLYREGILDPECFTDFYSQMVDKANSGRALSVFYCTWIAGEVNGVLRAAGKENMEYVSMPIRLNSQIENGDKRIVSSDTVNPYRSMVITQNAKYPERIMELLNWAATEEGQITLGWGIEGKHYNIVDGKRVVTEEFKEGYMNEPDYLLKQGIGLSVFSFLGLTGDVDANGQAYVVDYDPEVRNLLSSDRTKSVLNEYGWETDIDAWYSDPSTYEIFETGSTTTVSIPTNSEEGKLEEKLIEFRVKRVPELIMASDEAEFDALWDKLVEDYNALNPQTVIDMYNSIYAERSAQLEKLKVK